ncbi:MAG: DUF2232 domain-containing protein [Spirochaetaceae bacterium]|jgi:hypothetical protein|nr:DUF2232 domain-containing protein [Spirochaetaceae bacterium]
MTEQEGSALPAENYSALKTAGIALASAVIATGLTRSGFPAFFFLVPLGFTAYGYGFLQGWITLLGAVIINGLVSLAAALASKTPMPWADLVYFDVMGVIFIWITAPQARRNQGKRRLALAYRFMAGSVISALALWLLIEATSESLDAFLRGQGETLSALYRASAGKDGASASFLEQYATPEAISGFMGAVMLRGGAVASCALIFFVSRQLSLLFARLILRVRVGETHFYAAPPLIWILSFSLLGSLAGAASGAASLEILAWNMITVCALLYLAQGWGIARYFLSKRNLPPFMRILLTLFIIALLCSPVINAAALGLLVLLGIAENWVPFRAPKSD